MRIDGWEDRLAEVVERHQALPSDYGVSDCYIIADDAVEACLGERMHGAIKPYSTKQGAARRIREKGGKTVEDAFRARFDEVSPTLAQRGDLGVIDRDGETVGGVFTSIGLMVPTDQGKTFVPASLVRAAFKVI